MKRPLHFVMLLFLLAACHKDADVILRQEEIPDPPSVMVTTRLVSVADTTHDADAFGQVRLLSDWTDIGSIPFSVSAAAFTDQSYSTISWRTASGYCFKKFL